ncbi:MAG: flavodoxin family protein [Candidatus Omnitrophica bacterium]|nr:flavodoxin family protein [Candidatus Omnitrophota bacterium]
MKILGIAGSPRRNGNSERLLDKVLEGASSKGARVEKIVVSILRIKPCDGNSACWKRGRCNIKDDMQPIYKKLKSADAIVVASPVYFGSITAQLKAFIDRCQPIWVEGFILKKKIDQKKRKGIFISTSAHKNKKFLKGSKDVVETFFMVLGIKMAKSLHVTGLEGKKDILKHKDFLKKAFSYGVNIVAPDKNS